MTIRQFGEAVVVVGSLAVAVGSFLPFGESGTAARSSYELVQVAERIGFLEGFPATLARAWFLVPFAAALTLLGAATRRRNLARGTGTAVGLAGVWIAVAVARSPLVPRVGVYVCLSGSLLALAGGLVSSTRWRRRTLP